MTGAGEGARLVTIERFRVQQSAPIAHVLARGRDQGAEGGKPHVLVRLDGMGTSWLPEERLRSFPSGARCIEQYDALQLDGFGRAPLEHLLVVQALVPTLLCAKCEYRRPDLAFPGTWTCETKEAPRAKGPPSLCHFCNDAGRKVARGHPNASNAPPALPPAVQLAVEQSFPAAQEDAEAEATLIQVLIARRTVGRQGGASSDQHDLMRRALLLCRGDREAALGADESAGTTRKKGSAAIAIVKRAGHVCSLLVHEPPPKEDPRKRRPRFLLDTLCRTVCRALYDDIHISCPYCSLLRTSQFTNREGFIYRSRSTRLRRRRLPPPQSPHCAQRASHPAARRSAASRFGACTVKGSSVGMAALGAMV